MTPTTKGSWTVVTTISDEDARSLMAEVVEQKKLDRNISESAILRGMVRFCLSNKRVGWTVHRKVVP